MTKKYRISGTSRKRDIWERNVSSNNSRRVFTGASNGGSHLSASVKKLTKSTLKFLMEIHIFLFNILVDDIKIFSKHCATTKLLLVRCLSRYELTKFRCCRVSEDLKSLNTTEWRTVGSLSLLIHSHTQGCKSDRAISTLA